MLTSTTIPRVPCSVLMCFGIGLGCAPSPESELLAQIQDLDVQVSDIVPTVATISWSTDTEVSTWVEYGRTEDFERGSIHTDPTSLDQEVLLLGLTPDSDWLYRLGIEVNGLTTYTQTRHFWIDPVPSSLPEVTVNAAQSDRLSTDSSTLLTMASGTANVIAVLNHEGEYVWWFIDDTDDFWSSRARLSPDGSGILYNRDRKATYFNPDGNTSSIVHLSWTGEVITEYPIPNHHHDFWLHEDGTIATLVDSDQMVGDYELVAGSIHTVEPDGTETEIWSAWDTLTPPNDVPNGTDWTHFNALSFLPAENAYFVGSYVESSIYKVDAETGEIMWTMGGELSDWTLMDENDRWYSSQHQFQFVDDSVIVFDNRAQLGEASRVVEYALNRDTMEMTQIWEYTPEPRIRCQVLGDVDRLENGNTLVNWSAAGFMTELTPDGEKVWELGLSIGAVFGYMERIESLGPHSIQPTSD